jgi:hypothetical protein
VPSPRTKGRLGPQYRTRHPRIASALDRRRTPSGAAAAFTPASVATLDWWYDASQITAVEDEALAQWSDLSGNGNHLVQATEANKPLYKTAIRNSLPVVRFDGTNDQIYDETITTRTAQTVFLVVTKRSAPAAGTANMFKRTGPGNATLATASGVHAANYFWQHNEAAANVATGISANAWHIITVRVESAAAMTLRAEGGAATASFDPADAVTTGAVLRLAHTTAGADYDFAEVIGYSSALSTTDMDLVGNYLATKWGFTWVATS